MRIKVECVPPLVSVKAWFIVPPVANIEHLKTSLCTDIPSLQQQEVHAHDISLFLDGFELLDTSSLDVVRDGDLISVKQCVRPSQTSNLNKRKADSHDARVDAKRVKKSPLRTTAQLTVRSDTKTSQKPQHISSSAESDSDSDTDSSSASSSSGASSASSSGTSSSSGSSSSPSVEASVARHIQPQIRSDVRPTVAQDQLQPSKSIQVPIPPGQGKTVTKNRNLRRRRKKQYERHALEGSFEATYGVNDIPLGLRAPGAPTASLPPDPPAAPTIIVESSRPNVAPTFMMASLSNKNKRKGFKQAMASTLPKKIIFSAPEDSPMAGEDPALPFPASSSSEVTTAAPDIFARLIPPSEKQERGQLPSNMFVTSIDVEEGLFPLPKKRRKEVRQPPIQTEIEGNEDVVLDYGNEGMISTQREPHSLVAVDESSPHRNTSALWVDAEKSWPSLAKIANVSQIKCGTLVCWRALGINPASFTPEILLNIGEVITCTENLSLLPMYRPQLAFGASPEDDEEMVEPETYEWNEVLTGDWKIYK
ncbi:hypothetical protein BDW22DRAFT_1349085 [Trametopsis cervina]|nr:hypothetical protein BDW22DRAFT_1349085 [Trametopsis cervina]